MELRIADTFTASLARLMGDEQKAAKTTAFDLQLNPESPGLSFHKLDKAKDKRFWSVRVNDDLRIIVHRSEASLLLCYVDHHDKAYDWAERRKLETHPKTGAAQLVEIRETVQDVVVPRYTQVELPIAVQPQSKPKLFTKYTDEALLGYGIPAEWLPDVNEATDDTLLALVEHLPSEAGEALLELATGGTPVVAKPVPPTPEAPTPDPFAHPDAQRRFRVMANLDELKAALDAPWDKWTVFLHPAQRESVERDYSGPARVSGSAGTGKTIVALHRAVHLARANPDARVLLTTFSDILARSLASRLRRLIQSEPRLGERLEVHAIGRIGERLYEAHIGPPRLVLAEALESMIAEAAKAIPGHKFSLPFLLSEWTDIVDAWQVRTWEEYRDVKRLGRKTRLPETQRKTLWAIFEKVRAEFQACSLVTEASMFSALAERVATMKHPPFEFAVIDEAQDLRVAHLRFLAALGGNRPNALFFAGDLGQRIFQQPFSWKALGVDIRGRARTLTVNYRTSHQIRQQADRLLAPEVSDVDGNTDKRNAVSVFNGPPPTIQSFETQAAESAAVAKWLATLKADGVPPGEMAIFVRSDAQLDRARAAAQASALPFRVLDERLDTSSAELSVSTMHLAKGLEFRAVAVMACDDEVIPLQTRIESITDNADLEEVYNTERHLLYVACTRARDHLLVTSAGSASEFIADLVHLG